MKHVLKFSLLMMSLTLGFSHLTFADETRVIQVSAFAEKAATPDLVYLSVDIWSKNADAKKTQNLAAQKTKEAQTVFDQYKIKKDDIQTQSYTFAPEYVWDNKRNENRMNGFRSNQSLRITLRNTDQLGALIDSLTKAGTTTEVGVTIGQINWDSTKRDELELAALNDAVKVSRRRADEMAKASQSKIKRIYQMSHQMSGSDSMPIPMGKSARLEMAMTDTATSVSPGQVKIRVSVSATYEIE